MHRVTAALITPLFFLFTVYSFGWFCVPAPGSCSAIEMAGCCDEQAPEVSRACASSCERASEEDPAEDACDGPCAGHCKSAPVTDTKCIAATEPTRCENADARCHGRAVFSEEIPIMLRLCERPDNTRCASKPDVPQNCKPIRCILIHPLVADSPPKTLTPASPVAVDAPDLQPQFAATARAGPVYAQVNAIIPIVKTTVLRI